VSSECWACGGPSEPWPTLADRGFRRCADCGLIFRPASADATRAIYESDAYGGRAEYAADETIDERRGNARTRLGWLRGYASGGRLHDIAAAGGAFVLEAKLSGFDAFGVEPTPRFAEHARTELGVDVRDGRLEDLELEPASLDVATMWHVLEHIPEPRATLEGLRERLKPGGTLVAEVPNVESVAAAQQEARWTHLDPDVHVIQFSPATLRLMLERSGYQVVATRTFAHSSYLTARERWAPRHVAHRVRLARGGALGLSHPTRHEFLRVVARRP
jgi:SAM-dependent methyltransferase